MSKEPKTARTRVLVADDEASARTAMGALLTDEGFDVALAEDGSSAVTRFEEAGADVVVTDLRMPGSTAWRSCVASERLTRAQSSCLRRPSRMSRRP